MGARFDGSYSSISLNSFSRLSVSATENSGSFLPFCWLRSYKGRDLESCPLVISVLHEPISAKSPCLVFHTSHQGRGRRPKQLTISAMIKSTSDMRHLKRGRLPMISINEHAKVQISAGKPSLSFAKVASGGRNTAGVSRYSLGGSLFSQDLR